MPAHTAGASPSGPLLRDPVPTGAPPMPMRFHRRARVTAEELSACVAAVGPSWRPDVDPARPIVAVYSTKAPKRPWFLGFAAAAHGLPLVLAGLGQPGFTWYHGSAQRPVAIRRAAALLAALAPRATAAWADSGDTLLANPRLEDAALLEAVRARERSVLLGAECRSWPKCYSHLHARDAGFRACLRSGSPACFPNGGLAVGGVDAVAAYYDALSQHVLRWDALPPRSKLIGNVDRADDQALLHHLYANRTTDAALALAGLSLRLDSTGAVFVNLFPCDGPKNVRFTGPFASCYERPFNPLALLDVDERGATTYAARGAAARRPFLLHSNGDHARLRAAKLAPLREPYNTTAPPASWLSHPVLRATIDEAPYGNRPPSHLYRRRPAPH